MKKALSLVLALVLALSLSVCAFATSPITTNGGTDTGEVKVTVKEESTSKVYSVTVAWGDLTFTYDFGSKGTWEPSNHSYTGGTDAGWDKNSATITVTNHSNAAVWSTATYAAEAAPAITGVNVSLGENAGTRDEINAGVENQFAAADKNTYTVTVDGTPNGIGTDVKIGTITITIYHSAT